MSDPQLSEDASDHGGATTAQAPPALLERRLWERLERHRRSRRERNEDWPGAVNTEDLSLWFKGASVFSSDELREVHPDRPAHWNDWKELGYSPLKRPLAALVGPNEGLGHVVRAHVILQRTGTRLATLKADLKKRFDASGVQGNSYLPDIFRYTSDRRWTPPLDDLGPVLLEYVNSWRREFGLEGHPRGESLLSEPCIGEGAIDHFEAFLKEVSVPQEASNPAYKFVSSGARGAFLDDLCRAVLDEKKPTMLFNVYRPHARDSLRAVSEEIVRRLDEGEARRAARARRNGKPGRRRHVLLLPLQGDRSTPSLPRPLELDDDLPSDETLPELRDLLKRLREFVERHANGGTPAPSVPRAKEDVDSGESVAALIDAIRGHLLERGYIFVLDGHPSHDPERSPHAEAIERIMRNEPIPELLRTLLEPVISADTRARDLSEFARNRFIVTSDRALPVARESSSVPFGSAADSRSASPLEATVEMPWSRELPDPAASDVSQVVSLCVTEAHADVVQESVEAVYGTRLPSDAVLALLDTIVGLVRALVPALAEDTDAAHEGLLAVLGQAETEVDESDGNPVRYWTPRALATLMLSCLEPSGSPLEPFGPDKSRLAGAAAWRDLLLLVAVSPEGMRLDTMDRVLVRMEDVPAALGGGARALRALMNCGGVFGDEGHLRVHVRTFLRVMYLLLGLIRHEQVEASETDARDYEFREYHDRSRHAANEQSPLVPGTIDFRMPVVREAFRKAFREREGLGELRVVHRLVCEICLQMATVTLRHTEDGRRSSIEQWRRIVGSIYHGLASMDFDAHGQPVQHDYGRRDLVILGGAVGWWGYLYTRLYRSILQSMPDKRLTRIVGLDNFVRELHELFDRPWLIGDRNASAYDGMFSREEVQPEVRIEGALAAAHAALSRGEATRATPFIRRAVAAARQRPDAVSALPAAAGHAFKPDPSALAASDTRVDLQQRARVLRTELTCALTQLSVFDERLSAKALNEVVHAGKTGEAVRFPLEVLTKAADALEVALPEFGETGEDARTIMKFDFDEQLADGAEALSAFPPRLANVLCELWWKGGEQRAMAADFASSEPPDVLAEKFRLQRRLVRPVAALRRLCLGTAKTGENAERAIFLMRRRALAEYLVCEAVRARSSIAHPLAIGGRRTAAQARVAIRLALSLQYGPEQPNSIYRRIARRTADSLARETWRYPRDQANAFVTEAQFLIPGGARDERKRRELEAARGLVRRAERLLSTHDASSRSRLRTLLTRTRVHRALFHLTDDVVYGQLNRHDINSLGRIASEADADTRPYWQVMAAMQSAERFGGGEKR